MIPRGTVHGRIGRVKTEYSEDELPLDPAFAEVLLKWRTLCPASEQAWLFPNPNTGGVWHSSVLQGEILVPAGKKIGIDRLGWHMFRHSYRSMLDACVAPIGVQQKLMRHAQVSTTMLRIPVKWAADSGDVGQNRSEATLVAFYVRHVAHMSQEKGK
ncbi:MAG: hypothetical protein ACYCOX_09360 [Acidobacteriaceae bacterium]